jgi:peroxiredoxin
LLNHAAFTGSRPNFFKNNILYSTATWLLESDKTLNLDNNLYWYSGDQNPLWFYDNQPITSFLEYQKSSGQDPHSLYADPQLNNPTYHETGKPKEAFTLQAGSPAIDAGTDVGDMGKQDFFGNPIPGGKGYDIGAYEWSPGKISFLSPGVLQIGDYLPNVRLNAIRGGIYHLKELFGQATLLSILDTQAPISRKQIVFLRSMYQQFKAKGLKVVIIAADTRSNPSDLINFTYDWQLDSIPVLVGNSSVFNGWLFANRRTPTTYLISVEGKTQQRWDGLVLPFQLALAIQKEY